MSIVSDVARLVLCQLKNTPAPKNDVKVTITERAMYFHYDKDNFHVYIDRSTTPAKYCFKRKNVGHAVNVSDMVRLVDLIYDNMIERNIDEDFIYAVDVKSGIVIARMKKKGENDFEDKMNKMDFQNKLKTFLETGCL